MSHRITCLPSRTRFEVPQAAPSLARRQPFSNQAAFLTLQTGIALHQHHTVTTPESGIRSAVWIDRNTVDIGAVNEDVDRVVLSGRHTFQEHVLANALEAQRLNPGLTLYLGIPPENPQKYLPVFLAAQAGERGNSVSIPASAVSISLANRLKTGLPRPPTRQTGVVAPHLLQLNFPSRRFRGELARAGRSMLPRQPEASIPDSTLSPGRNAQSQAATSGQHHTSAPQLGRAQQNLARLLSRFESRRTSPSPEPGHGTALPYVDWSPHASVLSGEINHLFPRSISTASPQAAWPRVSGGGQTPLQTPVDWGAVRRTLDMAAHQGKNEPNPDEVRERGRHRMRQALFGQGSNPDGAAPLGEVASQAGPGVPDTCNLFMQITHGNKLAVATTILTQRVMGTFREGGVREQQQAWVDLLNVAWKAYLATQVAREAQHRREISARHLHELEGTMRNRLRDFLYESATRDVLGLGSTGTPVSVHQLDQFISSDRFRLFVDAVNQVHTHLKRQRPGNDRGFMASSIHTEVMWSHPDLLN